MFLSATRGVSRVVQVDCAVTHTGDKGDVGDEQIEPELVGGGLEKFEAA